MFIMQKMLDTFYLAGLLDQKVLPPASKCGDSMHYLRLFSLSFKVMLHETVVIIFSVLIVKLLRL